MIHYLRFPRGLKQSPTSDLRQRSEPRFRTGAVLGGVLRTWQRLSPRGGTPSAVIWCLSSDFATTPRFPPSAIMRTRPRGQSSERGIAFFMFLDYNENKEDALRYGTIQGSGQTGVDGLTVPIIAHNSRSRQPPGLRTAFPLAGTRSRGHPTSAHLWEMPNDQQRFPTMQDSHPPHHRLRHQGPTQSRSPSMTTPTCKPSPSRTFCHLDPAIDHSHRLCRSDAKPIPHNHLLRLLMQKSSVEVLGACLYRRGKLR